MKKDKLIVSLILIVLGVFLFVYGGADDSPGAQLLGLIVAILGVISIIKNKKRASKVGTQQTDKV